MLVQAAVLSRRVEGGAPQARAMVAGQHVPFGRGDAENAALSLVQRLFPQYGMGDMPGAPALPLGGSAGPDAGAPAGRRRWTLFGQGNIQTLRAGRSQT